MRNIAIGVIIGLVVAAMLHFFVLPEQSKYKSLYEDLSKDYNAMKGEFAVQDSIIDIVVEERNQYAQDYDSLSQSLSLSLTTIEKLTKPTHTEEDEKEALEWIRQYNESRR